MIDKLFRYFFPKSDEELLIERIESSVKKMRVFFTENGGDINFVRYKDGVVFVHIVGYHIGSPANSEKTREIVEAELRQAFPEIEKVELC